MTIDRSIKERGYYKTLKSILLNLFVKSGANSILRRLNRTPRILFWHGVDINPDSKVEPECINKRVFIKQIEYLQKYYEIISIDEFEKRLLNNSFTNREIVLTFDDGYANNLYVVEPILNKYNLPYTVFISTEHIATGQYFPTSVNRIIVKGSGLKNISIPSQNINFSIETEKDINNTIVSISNLLKTLTLKKVREITNDLINNVSKDKWLELQEKYNSVRPLNWDEVIELSNRKNVTIGSHCKYHICCHNNQDLEEVEKQIVESKQIIEDKLKIECNYFAYPNGDYTNSSNAIIRQAGYKMGFSIQKELSINNNNDLAVIPRIGVPQEINTFKIFTNIFPKR